MYVFERKIKNLFNKIDIAIPDYWDKIEKQLQISVDTQCCKKKVTPYLNLKPILISACFFIVFSTALIWHHNYPNFPIIHNVLPGRETASTTQSDPTGNLNTATSQNTTAISSFHSNNETQVNTTGRSNETQVNTTEGTTTVTVEGIAQYLIDNRCMAANAKYYTYEEALKQKQISSVIPQNASLVYVTQVIAYNNYVWLYACSGQASEANVMIEIENVSSADRLQYIKNNYRDLSSIPKDSSLISDAEKYNLSIFVDGYGVRFYNGNLFYHVVVVNPDIGLLHGVVNMVR